VTIEAQFLTAIAFTHDETTKLIFIAGLEEQYASRGLASIRAEFVEAAQQGESQSGEQGQVRFSSRTSCCT